MDLQELEPTWGRTISVWWLIAWRSVLGSLILAMAGGAGQAALEMSTIATPMIAKWVPQLIASILGAIWFAIVVRMALRKSYKGFRIALVPRT
jgi:hypothetical protein